MTKRQVIDRLKAAVEFYANERNWKGTSVFMCGHSGGARMDADRGEMARKTLESLTSGTQELDQLEAGMFPEDPKS